MPGPSEQDQAIATFNHAGEELRFYKGQQWQVTNYTLLVYAALAAAPELMGAWKICANVFCAVAVGLVAAVSCLVLTSLELAVNKERDRMRAARWKLPLVQEIHDKFKPRYRWVALLVLRVIVVGGALLAISINVLRVPSWACVVACLPAGAV